MPRPRRLRRIGFRKRFYSFKPSGVPAINLKTSILTVGEFEAIRLKDFKRMSQKDSAKKMDVSQPTFHRLLISARNKIADAIVNGKEIRIQGGEYIMPDLDRTGPRPVGQGLGKGRRRGFGRTNYCVCPNCGNKVPHMRGKPCVEQKCPKCGSNMAPEQ